MLLKKEYMPVTAKPRKVRYDGIPDELIGKALISCAGRLYHAGDKLGISGATVHDRVQRSPYLQQIREQCLQKRLDAYEKALDKLGHEDHNLGAICFALKTLGRTRGYIENPQPSFGTEIAQGLDSVLKQLAEHQKVRRIADISESQE
jgi:hypothetical protein